MDEFIIWDWMSKGGNETGYPKTGYWQQNDR